MKHLLPSSLGIIGTFLTVLFGWLLISSAAYEESTYLDVKQGSVELSNSGDEISQIIDYYITVEPKITGRITVDIFKNDKFLRTDTLSDRNVVKLASGGEYYYYKLTISGKKDHDIYQIEFKYDDQTVKKIIPITSTSMGIVNIESPLKQFKSGTPIGEIQCKEGLELTLKASDGSPICVKPETKQKLIGREWAKPATVANEPSRKDTEIDTVKKLLSQNQIEYIPDKIIVASGPSLFDGDPRCGAVIDVDSVTHWFAIDSISEPQNMTIFSENPNPCKVNTESCFCSVQMELAVLTLDELSYFSSEEEEKVANTLIDYLVKENINRTPKFMVGKFNLNYTDPSAIGYCGELWGYNTIDYFDGAIVNDQVKDYGLAKELSPLCAISENAKWWEKK